MLNWFKKLWTRDPERVVTMDIDIGPTGFEQLREFDQRLADFRKSRPQDETLQYGATIDPDSI